MKDKKDHLNIDLEFLDKKEASRESMPATDESSPSAPRSAAPVSTGYKHNWRNIAIIGGIVLVIIWAIASSDDSSTNSTSSGSYVPSTQTSNYNNNDTVIRGDYSCSSYEASRADALDPSESEATLTIAQNSIEQRSRRLENLKDEIDSSYVSEYSSQWEIDDYNQKVDEYNSLLPGFKRDAESLSSRIDRYNAQVEARNNYLRQNCTPR